MGVSGNLWIVIKVVKPLVYDVESEMAMDSMKGKCAWSWVDLGYMNVFYIPEVTSVFFSCCDSVLGDSLQFHQGNRGSLLCWLGTRNSSSRNAGELGLILRQWGSLLSFLELLQAPVVYSLVTAGWPFETRVCSAKSGVLSSYDGQLGKLNYAWQENTYASGHGSVGQASLIFGTVILVFLSIFTKSQTLSAFEAMNSAHLSMWQKGVRPSVQRGEGLWL